MKLPARVTGYGRRIAHELQMAKFRGSRRRQRGVFRKWLAGLQASPPDVLVGANFAKSGGVRHHISAIVKHCQSNVGLAPPSELDDVLTSHVLSEVLNDEFEGFRPHGISALHSHVFPWFIQWCANRKKDGFRWIHTYHLNYYPEHSRNGLLEPLQQEINTALIDVACHADVKLSVSLWQVEELRDLYGIESSYLPNGVDVSLSRKASADRFRRQHKVPSNFILYVGRNDPVKNPREFVQLAIELKTHEFVMIGGGLDHASILSDYGLELPINVTCLGGVSQQSVQDAIAACTALVVTSKREGLPTLVMEGMALAKPIVVSDEPGSAEAVDHGKAGLVYRLGNVGDLAEKTLQAVTGNAVNLQARQRVESEYDWRVVAPKLDRIYDAQ